MFENGTLEVQDEGSQLLAHLVGPKRGEMVVDFCAGAGGKTLALGALMRGTGRLYAFDVSAKRLERLKPRLVRSGLSNVVISTLANEHDVIRRRPRDDTHGARMDYKLDRMFLSIWMHDAVFAVIAAHRPDRAAAEEIFVNKNPQSTLKLAQARGAVLAACGRAGLPVAEHAARLVKKAIVGTGAAEKPQVQAMLKVLLPMTVARPVYA